MRKLILALCFLLWADTLTQAGIEPFLKGEWSMTPAEIIKVHGELKHNTNPVHNTIGYDYKLFGVTVPVSYAFDNSNQLYMVTATVVADIQGYSEYVSFMNELSDTIQSQETMEFVYFERVLTQETHVFGASWINEKTYLKTNGAIPMEKGSLQINIAIYPNNKARYQQDFDVLKTQSKSVENVGKIGNN